MVAISQLRPGTARRYANLMKTEGLEVQNACAWPSWQTTMKASSPYKSADDNSTIIDESYRHAPSLGWV